MSDRECDTYVVLSPADATLRARCCCGWAAPPRPVSEINAVTCDEIEHLYLFVLRQVTEERHRDA